MPVVRRPYQARSKDWFYTELSKVRKDFKQYKLIGSYKSLIDRYKVEHTVCGRTFEATGYQLKSYNKQCPYCTTKSPHQFDKITFTKQLALQQPEYKLIGEYTKFNERHKFRHDCGNVFEARARFILRGEAICQICHAKAGKKINSFNTKTFKAVLKAELPDYKLVGEFTSLRKQHEFKHTCGRTFKALPTSIRNGVANCPCLHEKLAVHTEKTLKKNLIGSLLSLTVIRILLYRIETVVIFVNSTMVFLKNLVLYALNVILCIKYVPNIKVKVLKPLLMSNG